MTTIPSPLLSRPTASAAGARSQSPAIPGLTPANGPATTAAGRLSPIP
jgi:hypothetical protein